MTDFPDNPSFLLAPGETAELMRRRDWTGSVLGHPSTWQPELAFLVRMMLESTFPSFIAWGPELGFLYNDAYARILEEKHPAAMGDRFRDIWGEIWDDISPIIDTALAGKSSYHADLPLTVFRKGYPEQAWFTFSYSPVYLKGTEVGGMHCTVIETTATVLAQMEQALRLALTERLHPTSSDEDIFREAAGLAGEFIGVERAWFAEIDHHSRHFSTRHVWGMEHGPAIPGAGTVDDYGPELVSLLQQGRVLAINDISLDPYFGAFADAYRALGIGSLLIIPLVKDGQLVTNLNLTRTGVHHWAQHDIDMACTVARHAWSMIERSRIERANQENELRYKTLINNVDEGFAIVELLYEDDGTPYDYRFLEVNPAFYKQSGMTDVTGKTLRALTPELESFWVDMVARVALNGTPERAEHQSRRSGRWINLYASRLDLDDHRRVALLFSDVTGRKLIEEELRNNAAELAEANRRKTEFLATLAHELRNPLAPMRTGLELMRVAASNPKTISQVREMLGRQMGHMVRLIDDLLDIARISSGKVVLQKEATDLKMLVSHAVETALPLVEANRHNLEISMPDHPVMIDADPVRIEQVLVNLLTNAAKYTPNGGRIRLAVEPTGSGVRVSVADNGVGLAPEAIDVVFDIFAQVGKSLDRSRGGLGIGLAIVRQLVQMHGGSISVHSPGPGAGSTFSIVLPSGTGTSGQPDTSASVAVLPAATGRYRILVADDNADAAEMLTHLLAAAGHQIDVAHDGSAALDLARRTCPDIAILDIGMPNMTGYEVARSLRGMPGMQGATLIALTGWGTQEDRARTLDAGFDFHLTKPVSYEVLSDLLAQHARA